MRILITGHDDEARALMSCLSTASGLAREQDDERLCGSFDELRRGSVSYVRNTSQSPGHDVFSAHRASQRLRQELHRCDYVCICADLSDDKSFHDAMMLFSHFRGKAIVLLGINAEKRVVKRCDIINDWITNPSIHHVNKYYFEASFSSGAGIEVLHEFFHQKAMVPRALPPMTYDEEAKSVVLGSTEADFLAEVAMIPSADINYATFNDRLALRMQYPGVFSRFKAQVSSGGATKECCLELVENAQKPAMLVCLDTTPWEQESPEQMFEGVMSLLKGHLAIMSGKKMLKFVISGSSSRVVVDWLNELSSDFSAGGLQVATNSSQLSGAVRDLMVSVAKPRNMLARLTRESPDGKKLPIIPVVELLGRVEHHAGKLSDAVVKSHQQRDQNARTIEAKRQEILRQHERRSGAGGGPARPVESVQDVSGGSPASVDDRPSSAGGGPARPVESVQAVDHSQASTGTSIQASTGTSISGSAGVSSNTGQANDAARQAGLAALARAGLSALGKESRLDDDTKIEPPSEYICPISRDLMNDPVVAEDGFTYDRLYIESWLQDNSSSPMNREQMGRHLLPNRTMKSAIEKWKADHPSYGESRSGKGPS